MMPSNSGASFRSPTLAEGWGCAKVILVGEHFVVHGAPALALPLDSVGTRVTLRAANAEFSCLRLPKLADSEKSRHVVDKAFDLLGVKGERQSVDIAVESTVPLGQGLGSSASYGLALLRAISQAFDLNLGSEELSQHAYTIEKIFHGRPSGVDNTVIAHERPVIFSAKAGMELIQNVSLPRLVLASTGNEGSTQEAVAKVRRHQQEDRDRFAVLCDAATAITRSCASLLSGQEGERIGELLDQSHALLQEVGVSTEELDTLVDVARSSGAYGAKLTGAGLGGFMLAAVEPKREDRVRESLKRAGAKEVITMGGYDAS